MTVYFYKKKNDLATFYLFQGIYYFKDLWNQNLFANISHLFDKFSQSLELLRYYLFSIRGLLPFRLQCHTTKLSFHCYHAWREFTVLSCLSPYQYFIIYLTNFASRLIILLSKYFNVFIYAFFLARLSHEFKNLLIYSVLAIFQLFFWFFLQWINIFPHRYEH